MTDEIDNVAIEAINIAAVEAAPVEKVAEANTNITNILSDDLKEIGELSKFKDVNELAKSYVNLNKLLGKRFSDLSQEELNQYYTKLGKPEKHEDYVLPEEGKAEDRDWYKNIVFEAGLTKEQAKLVYEKYIEKERSASIQRNQEIEKSQQQAVDVLKAEFGTAFDQRLNLAKSAVREFGGEEIVKILNDSGLGNNAAIIKMFANIGKNFQEDKIISSDKSKQFGLTPTDARNKINMLKKDPEIMRAYMDGTHHKHRQVVAEMSQLYELIG